MKMETELYKMDVEEEKIYKYELRLIEKFHKAGFKLEPRPIEIVYDDVDYIAQAGKTLKIRYNWADPINPSSLKELLLHELIHYVIYDNRQTLNCNCNQHHCEHFKKLTRQFNPKDFASNYSLKRRSIKYYCPYCFVNGLRYYWMSSKDYKIKNKKSFRCSNCFNDYWVKGTTQLRPNKIISYEQSIQIKRKSVLFNSKDLVKESN